MEDIEQIKNHDTRSEEVKKSEKPYTMDANIEAAIAYLLAPLTSIVVLLSEKEDKFVRFHAMQATLFGIAVIVAQTLASALVPVLIGVLLLPLVGVVSFGLWLFLMWKAYNKEEFELPYLGKMARDHLK